MPAWHSYFGHFGNDFGNDDSGGGDQDILIMILPPDDTVQSLATIFALSFSYTKLHTVMIVLMIKNVIMIMII